MSNEIHVIKFRGVDKPKGESTRRSWDDLIELFKNPKVYSEKIKMPLFSFTEFEGNQRSKENAGMVHAIAVEHDGEEVSPEDAADVMRSHGIASIIYTTPRHTWDAPRWRMVVKLAQPVDEIEHNRLVRILNELLDGAIAAECLDTERQWYYGRVDGVEYECIDVKGDAMDDLLDFDLPDIERDLGDSEKDGTPKRRVTDSSDMMSWVLPTPEPPTKEAADRIRSVLEASKVDPNAQHTGDKGRGPMTWSQVVMALHSTQHPDAKSIAEEWSKGARGRVFDQSWQDEFDNYWDSMVLDRHSVVTFGTLVFHAKALSNWVDPWSVSDDIMESYGDLANGQRFASKHRGEFLYIAASKEWVRWDGMYWKVCKVGEQVAAAKEIAIDGLRDAAEKKATRGAETDNANYRMANKIVSDIGRTDAMLKSAHSEPGMAIPDRALFDREPYLIGVQNGVVNLLTGELLKPHQSMLISRQLACKHEAGAKCPKFLEFMNDIFPDGDEMVEFMQRACGMALLGEIFDETMIFMVGSGSNGKSVFANVLKHIFGDYVAVLDASVLLRSRSGNNSEATREKARLQGVRLVLMNEVETDDVFSDKVVKDMVSTEAITARNLYEKSFEFIPMHTIFLRGNHLPGVKDTTDGFWRRMALIEFKRQFAAHEKIPNLANIILKKECNGIFMWMLEGCMKVKQANSLVRPVAVDNLVDEYRKDSDIIGQWIDARCDEGAELSVPLQAIYDDYKSHMREVTPAPPMGKLKLKKVLAERGFSSAKRTIGQTVIGLALKEMLDPFTPIDDEL